MQINSLAVVVPIHDLHGNDQNTRAAVWQQTSQLLLTQLGKRYTGFQPAQKAWNQSVNLPFGAILGRSDPALFLYFYAAAQKQQEAIIRGHLEKFLEGTDITSKNELPGVVMYAVGLKDDGSEIAPHLEWHLAMLGGELLPDSGIYYLQEHRGLSNKAMDKEILSHLDSYALCVADLMMEDAA